jgi:hypothetical protein
VKKVVVMIGEKDYFQRYVMPPCEPNIQEAHPGPFI